MRAQAEHSSPPATTSITTYDVFSVSLGGLLCTNHVFSIRTSNRNASESLAFAVRWEGHVGCNDVIRIFRMETRSCSYHLHESTLIFCIFYSHSRQVTGKQCSFVSTNNYKLYYKLRKFSYVAYTNLLPGQS